MNYCSNQRLDIVWDEVVVTPYRKRHEAKSNKNQEQDNFRIHLKNTLFTEV
jgi:hypothetical protein